jgi:SPP1 family predicted phage head-tail adaptor
MNPGKRNKRITFLQNPEGQGSYGNEEGDWPEFATVWASIDPIRGREFFAAQQVNSEITHKINIRYRTGIKSDMKIKYGIRNFDIISPPIDLEERHRELEFMCREVV